MHDIIDFLKRAVTRDSEFVIMGCYFVQGGTIYARNLGIQAGAPFPALVTADFNVPAKALEAALDRMRGAVDLTYNGGAVTVRSSHLKVEIPCIAEEPPAVPTMPEVWQGVPEGFMGALKVAVMFAAKDPGWNNGIRLMGDRITAINNRSGVDITVPGLGARGCCITTACAEFILAQKGSPTQLCLEESAIIFKWSDDKWLQAQYLASEFPDAVDRILAAGGGECPVVLTPEWRAAYADIAALSDGRLQIQPDKMVAVTGASTADYTIETALPPGAITYWSEKALDPVVAVAEAWAPASWPKPAAFRGPNLRGVVMGVQ
jgi:hypothetical protein